MLLDTSRLQVLSLLLESELKTETEWKKAEDFVRSWFADLKVAESADTFDGAFQDGRLTMRAILEDRHTGFYKQNVPNRGYEDKLGDHEIKTMQGIPGIQARMNQHNFFGVGKLLRKKYTEGLFDVSAVLLNPKFGLKIGGGGIAPTPPSTTAPVSNSNSSGPPPPPPPPSEDSSQNQIYRTTGNTTYVFMPVAREADHLVFFALNHYAKSSASAGLRSFTGYMRSRLTRIKLAFGEDAGAKFIDFAGKGELLPKFRYGFGKLLPSQTSLHEIWTKKLAATGYKSVLTSGKRNEIIVAYRQHGALAMQPSQFPVFAKGVFKATRDKGKPVHLGYLVIEDGFKSLGKIITLAGRMISGTTETFGKGATLDAYPRDPIKN